MTLSSDILQQFANVVAPKEEKKKETTVYGTAHVDGENITVRIDGSSIETPALYTAAVNDGDRVLVTIRNRTAVITGNMTTKAGEPPGYSALKTNVNNHISNDAIHLGPTDMVNTISDALNDSSNPAKLLTSGIVKELKAYIRDCIYPVGSVYIYFGIDEVNPATTIGGTWSEVMDHRADDDPNKPRWHFWQRVS